MNTCCRDGRVVEYRGTFAGGTSFRIDPKGGLIRTTCAHCGTFLGYRRADVRGPDPPEQKRTKRMKGRLK